MPAHGDKISYQRVLIKVSGESLAGEQGFGISVPVLGYVADEIIKITTLGVGVGIVIGGGNIFRGVSDSAAGMDRSSADYVGMMATVMNALALQEAIERRGVQTRVQSAIPITQLAEPYIRRRAIRHIERGRIVIFASGTGNPFFTTDTAAALRAMEIGADILLKATRVPGVFDKDPMLHTDATLYETLSFQEAIAKNLEIMDATAFTLCQTNKLPLIVFDLGKEDNMYRIVLGEQIGTTVKP